MGRVKSSSLIYLTKGSNVAGGGGGFVARGTFFKCGD